MIDVKIVVFLFSLMLTSCGPPRSTVSAPATPQRSPGVAEAAFLSTRAEHSEMEAQFLDLCSQRAARTELKSFCAGQAAQERERAAEFRSWLQSWHPAVVTGNVARGDIDRHKESISKVESAAASNWEEIFLHELRQRSRQETAELDSCPVSAAHTELRDRCGQLKSTHDQNERQMDQWICQWYRDCAEKH
jgi:uncharacterized protein (DUF305 family)